MLRIINEEVARVQACLPRLDAEEVPTLPL